MTSTTPPQDKRGYFFVPQFYEGGGYYVYGTPENGGGQYAHPKMMTFLMMISHCWCAVDDRKFGVGNISLAGGVPYPEHGSHKSGLEVDIRPMTQNGARMGVTCTSASYDRAATAKLVDVIWKTGMVKAILFNDTRIPRVRPFPGHSNHLHVVLYP